MDERDEQPRGPGSLERIISLGALVSDPDNVNWAALWSAWLELYQEVKGSEMEHRIVQRGRFIPLEDANGFVAELVALEAESTGDDGRDRPD